MLQKWEQTHQKLRCSYDGCCKNESKPHFENIKLPRICPSAYKELFQVYKAGTKVYEYKRQPLICTRCLEYGHPKVICRGSQMVPWIQIYFWILLHPSQILIRLPFFRLNWHHTEFRLELNKSEKGNYNPNLVWFNRIQKKILCVFNVPFCER